MTPSTRLVALTSDERRALELVRQRASRGLVITNARCLAADMLGNGRRPSAGTNVDRARLLLARLGYKGWLTPDRNRTDWLPTMMAHLADHMATVEALLSALALAQPADLPRLRADARRLIDDERAVRHVPSPVVNAYASAQAMRLEAVLPLCGGRRWRAVEANRRRRARARP